MKKRALLLLGLVTLLAFPIPTFIGLYFLEGTSPMEILDLKSFNVISVGFGLQIGFVYGIIALLFMQSKVFEDMPTRMENIIARMNLSIWDCVFLSICAGVGEELLFRSGVQLYLGPILTSVLFVAIHGYLNPMNWRMSIYGLIVLPFILIISYGFDGLGLWFSAAAHFMYDLVLFLAMRKSLAANNS